MACILLQGRERSELPVPTQPNPHSLGRGRAGRVLGFSPKVRVCVVEKVSTESWGGSGPHRVTLPRVEGCRCDIAVVAVGKGA